MTPLEQSLIAHEGLKFKPYVDTVGKISCGIGRNLTDKGISEAEAMAMMRADIVESISELDRAFHGWRNHSQVRQDVLVELQFNMGANRLAGFKKFWAAMAVKDYATAASELMASKWATQVGQRAKTLSDRIRSGVQ